MNWFQIYAFYVMPFIVLGIGLFLYYIAVRDSRAHERDRHVPGE